jgi:hypothetical protein
LRLFVAAESGACSFIDEGLVVLIEGVQVVMVLLRTSCCFFGYWRELLLVPYFMQY